MRNFYKGLVIALPISLAMWAVLLIPVAVEAEHHPRAFARVEAKVLRTAERYG